MYNNCGGERMALYVDNAGSTLYGDLTKQSLLDFNYAVMGFKEGSYKQIPHTGLSPDYVSRETKRALDGVAGTNTLIWPGIDIDIPTDPGNSKCTPQSVKQAVLAALRAGAPGVILSRKYSEMWLAHLSGAGDAMREFESQACSLLTAMHDGNWHDGLGGECWTVLNSISAWKKHSGNLLRTHRCFFRKCPKSEIHFGTCLFDLATSGPNRRGLDQSRGQMESRTRKAAARKFEAMADRTGHKEESATPRSRTFGANVAVDTGSGKQSHLRVCWPR
jgi:hypothetical protein